MAQGNIYLLGPKAEKDNQVPLKLKEKWKFKETVVASHDGSTSEVDLHPSWLQAGNKLKSAFGEIREVTVNAQPYLLIEMELSFIEGEVAEVQKLQSSTPTKKAHYRMLTNEEAKAILSGVNLFL